MRKIFLIAILILICMAAIGGFKHDQNIKAKVAAKIMPEPEKVAAKVMSKSETELRSSMRTLWESRATLLRAYIVSEMNESRDTDEAKDKLLKNARDLGASIQPYYGYFARSILTGFLKNDVLLTVKVIKSAKLGNKVDLDWNKDNWYANAFLLAGFFAITHNQTKEDLKDMLYKHLDLTMGEIEAILKKEEKKDLDYYEKDRAHMVMVSDVLVDGLVKQMPNKFKE